MRNLGLIIRTIREARGMSLAEVASAARIGVPFLSLVERNERNTTPETLKAIANALSLPADLLLMRAGYIHPEAPVSETASDLAKTLDKLERVEAALREQLGLEDAAR